MRTKSHISLTTPWYSLKTAKDFKATPKTANKEFKWNIKANGTQFIKKFKTAPKTKKHGQSFLLMNIKIGWIQKIRNMKPKLDEQLWDKPRSKTNSN